MKLPGFKTASVALVALLAVVSVPAFLAAQTPRTISEEEWYALLSDIESKHSTKLARESAVRDAVKDGLVDLRFRVVDIEVKESSVRLRLNAVRGQGTLEIDLPPADKEGVRTWAKDDVVSVLHAVRMTDGTPTLTPVPMRAADMRPAKAGVAAAKKGSSPRTYKESEWAALLARLDETNVTKLAREELLATTLAGARVEFRMKILDVSLVDDRIDVELCGRFGGDRARVSLPRADLSIVKEWGKWDRVSVIRDVIAKDGEFTLSEPSGRAETMSRSKNPGVEYAPEPVAVKSEGMLMAWMRDYATGIFDRDDGDGDARVVLQKASKFEYEVRGTVASIEGSDLLIAPSSWTAWVRASQVPSERHRIGLPLGKLRVTPVDPQVMDTAKPGMGVSIAVRCDAPRSQYPVPRTCEAFNWSYRFLRFSDTGTASK
ncbi:MAG: hypothetical protein HMLKMBBP_00654 [Planctomycetes bacterium]|nr:hypothetical protein [Planctomycetota bacterium]